MIVIAIIGILAAIAIPAYKYFIIRAKVSEGISLASAIKLAVGETYDSEGFSPDSNGAAGIADSATISGNDVMSVTISGISAGLIIITYGVGAPPEIQSDTLLLSPSTTLGAIQWTCKPGSIDNRYLPSICRS